MRLALQVGLVLVIAVLAYVLYWSITAPYQEQLERERETAIGRERLDDVRSALISFRDAYNDYPSTLDSLVTFVETDSAWAPPDFEDEETRLSPFSSTDSLQISARNGAPLNYEVVQQTDSTGTPTGVKIYWLQDPAAPGESIGSRDANPSNRNRESWI
ncbi:MAG: hypothetical protein AAF791_06515 [Bacteroidota bacterium]